MKSKGILNAVRPQLEDLQTAEAKAICIIRCSAVILAEALGIEDIKPAMKLYLKNIIETESLSGIHLKCAEILYVKLFGTTSLHQFLINKKMLLHNMQTLSICWLIITLKITLHYY